MVSVFINSQGTSPFAFARTAEITGIRIYKENGAISVSFPVFAMGNSQLNDITEEIVRQLS